VRIADLRQAGHCVRAIVEQTGRSPSTISRKHAGTKIQSMASTGRSLRTSWRREGVPGRGRARSLLIRCCGSSWPNAILDATYDRRMTWYAEIAAKVSVIDLEPYSLLMNALLGAAFEDEHTAGLSCLDVNSNSQVRDKEREKVL
jgi:hypothetical protein